MKKNFNLLGLVAAWIAVYALFCFLVPKGRFIGLDSIELLLRQSTIVAAVSIGMTYVIIGGGIDLSVGSTAAFSSVVIAFILQGFGKHPPIWAPIAAALGGAFVGTACGFINGLLITRLKVVPFIVTLGTLLVVRAVGKGVAKDETIYPPDTPLNGLLAKVGEHERWHLLPWGVWITLGLALLMAVILRHTRFGRHVIAVGSNESAARLSGVPIDWVKLRVYALSGLFAGIAGLMLFSELTVGDPTAVVGLELDAIAAVVIGGASLAGGEGSIWGALIGALVIRTIWAGGSQMGLPNWVQEIVTGTIIVLAVALDRWRARRALSRVD
jgi:ribose/xylose/arabinose/galactoside ABC-type transport system permease subunit